MPQEQPPIEETMQKRNELPFHLARARENGVSLDELV